MRRASALLVLAVSASLVTLAPSTARSEDTTGYGLYVTPKKAADHDSATLLQKLLRAQLAKYHGVTVVEHVGSSGSAADFKASIEAGFRALNDAVASKEAASAKAPGAAALAEFGKAEASLAQLAGADVALRDVARLHKGLAVAHALNKEGPKAQSHMAASLGLWPKQTAREYAWNIEVSNLFGFVQKRLTDSTDAGKIEVKGIAGAKVVVDGRNVGQVPTTVDRVSPGPHWIVVTAEGYGRLNKLVQVTKDETAAVAAALSELPTKARAQELVALIGKQKKADKAKPLLDELAQKVGAQRVIVLQVGQKKAKWQLTGYTGGAGETSKQKAVVARDAQMMASLQGLLTAATGMSPGSGAASAPGSDSASLGGPPKASLMALAGGKDPKKGAKKIGAGVDDTEFYETWWFWTAVGGGVVVVATAAILAVVLTADDTAAKYGAVDIDLREF